MAPRRIITGANYAYITVTNYSGSGNRGRIWPCRKCPRVYICTCIYEMHRTHPNNCVIPLVQPTSILLFVRRGVVYRVHIEIAAVVFYFSHTGKPSRPEDLYVWARLSIGVFAQDRLAELCFARFSLRYRCSKVAFDLRSYLRMRLNKEEYRSFCVCIYTR